MARESSPPIIIVSDLGGSLIEEDFVMRLTTHFPSYPRSGGCH